MVRFHRQLNYFLILPHTPYFEGVEKEKSLGKQIIILDRKRLGKEFSKNIEKD
jgi:hypothetical protein